jgi:hypothetical protein
VDLPEQVVSLLGEAVIHVGSTRENQENYGKSIGKSMRNPMLK